MSKLWLLHNSKSNNFLEYFFSLIFGGLLLLAFCHVVIVTLIINVVKSTNEKNKENRAKKEEKFDILISNHEIGFLNFLLELFYKIHKKTAVSKLWKQLQGNSCVYFNKFARLNAVVLLKKTINLDDCKSIGTHWITPYVNGNNWRASMLTMPPTLTDLELNIFQKKKKKS